MSLASAISDEGDDGFKCSLENSASGDPRREEETGGREKEAHCKIERYWDLSLFCAKLRESARPWRPRNLPPSQISTVNALDNTQLYREGLCSSSIVCVCEGASTRKSSKGPLGFHERPTHTFDIAVPLKFFRGRLREMRTSSDKDVKARVEVCYLASHLSLSFSASNFSPGTTIDDSLGLNQKGFDHGKLNVPKIFDD